MHELTPEEKEALFPAMCHFKIIAENVPTMEEQLTAALHSAGVDESLSPGNQSAAGTYITYNVSLLVATHEEMLTIDSALRAVEGVRIVL